MFYAYSHNKRSYYPSSTNSLLRGNENHRKPQLNTRQKSTLRAGISTIDISKSKDISTSQRILPKGK